MIVSKICHWVHFNTELMNAKLKHRLVGGVRDVP